VEERLLNVDRNKKEQRQTTSQPYLPLKTAAEECGLRMLIKADAQGCTDTKKVCGKTCR
jgi:hypothetical protein